MGFRRALHASSARSRLSNGLGKSLRRSNPCSSIVLLLKRWSGDSDKIDRDVRGLRLPAEFLASTNYSLCYHHGHLTVGP